ncbi:gas vesicle protein [Streptomyces sp. NPDC002577]
MTVVERREIALVDLLDRLLAGGVVITGDITLRIADVDLVRIDLNALVSSVNEQVPSPWQGLQPETLPEARSRALPEVY